MHVFEAKCIPNSKNIPNKKTMLSHEQHCECNQNHTMGTMQVAFICVNVVIVVPSVAFVKKISDSISSGTKQVANAHESEDVLHELWQGPSICTSMDLGSLVEFDLNLCLDLTLPCTFTDFNFLIPGRLLVKI